MTNCLCACGPKHHWAVGSERTEHSINMPRRVEAEYRMPLTRSMSRPPYPSSASRRSGIIRRTMPAPTTVSRGRPLSIPPGSGPFRRKTRGQYRLGTDRRPSAFCKPAGPLEPHCGSARSQPQERPDPLDHPVEDHLCFVKKCSSA
jgi:hypothetical protein